MATTEQRTLAGLRNDPECFGVLKPARDGEDMKAVCLRTALLWLSLRTPGALPRCLLDPDEGVANAAVARLVLDHIIEIETERGFVGGAAWCPIERPDANLVGEGVIGRLSLDALRYAAALRLHDPLVLSSRLYDYFRLPQTPEIVSSLGEAAERAGIWRLAPPLEWSTSTTEYWRYFSRRGAPPARCKAYVSPMPSAFVEVFERLMKVFDALPVCGFKIGSDTEQLLRPDKCVVYLPDRKALEELCAALSPIVATLPAHGVPFTAALESRGVLSWGADPPRDDARLPWQGPSWRRWITDRLAVTLCGGARLAESPLQFALERLRLEGVDTTTWAPLDPGVHPAHA
ncbi:MULTISPECIES: hypothetical protein [Lysobacteraceae]|nr:MULTISPECIES: hypothetical protein [Lysobacter]